jgi:hypothetical protein
VFAVRARRPAPATLAVLFALVALTSSTAEAGTRGALTQMPGLLGCSSTGGVDGCEGVHGAGVQETGITVSPDGKNVYATTDGGILMAFGRDPATGHIRQLPGKLGCYGRDADPNVCTVVSTQGNAQNPTMSPDGTTLYVAVNDGLMIYSRDTSPGGVGGLTEAACVIDDSQHDANCQAAHGLFTGSGPLPSLAVSPDGASLYVGALQSIAAFHRGSGGSLTQPLGHSGCVQPGLDPLVPCTPGGAMRTILALAVSPDGTSLYAISDLSPAAVITFSRTSLGDLALTGCFANIAETNCVEKRGIFAPVALVVNPSGTKVTVADSAGAVTPFDRAPSGALSQPAGQAACLASDYYNTNGIHFVEGCGTAQGIGNTVNGIAQSPDGSSIYLSSSAATSVFDVDPVTHDMVQLAGSEGCLANVDEPATPTPSCAVPSHGFGYPTSRQPIAVSASNRGDAVYIGGSLQSGQTGTGNNAYSVTQFARQVSLPPCADTNANGNTDDDGDSLCDNWETTGIDENQDGTVDLQLYDDNGDGTISAGEQADPQHKDVYVEIDFMAGHRPKAAAIQDVVDSFANAPVTNPDGTTGVRLHVQIDETVPDNSDVAFPPCTVAALGSVADFDTIKDANFGTAAERAAGAHVTIAKRFAFRYNLWAHALLGLTSTSGCAELPGNDFVVSLGLWQADPADPPGTHANGWPDAQAGTFMHELGHTLGLHHGGNDDFNCKPNYLSVMSYARQISGAPIPRRPLDYSRSVLATLFEGNLDETAGIGGPTGSFTAFGSAAGPAWSTPGDAGVDWNRNGFVGDRNVVADVNTNVPNSGCNGAGDVLNGNDDWSNLVYDFRTTSDFADGAHASSAVSPEITSTQVTAASDTDGDGVANTTDNCVNTANPDQADANGDGVGDACPPASTSTPKPPSGPAAPGRPPPDTTKPSISGFKVSNKRFAAGGAGAGLSARRKAAPKGTTFAFRLSEAASVRLVIEARTSGRRVGKACRARSRANAKKKLCTRYVRRGALVSTGRAGAGTIRFTGRVRTKALPRGAYRASIIATDAAKNVSVTRTVTFTIVAA